MARLEKIEGFDDRSIIVSDNTRARFVDGDEIGEDVGAVVLADGFLEGEVVR